jgi:hypothetical protein
MMANRANTAKPLHKYRNFPERPAFDESLKASELDNVQTSLLDYVFLVKQNRDFAVSFDAGYGLYYYSSQFFRHK